MLSLYIAKCPIAYLMHPLTGFHQDAARRQNNYTDHKKQLCGRCQLLYLRSGLDWRIDITDALPSRERVITQNVIGAYGLHRDCRVIDNGVLSMIIGLIQNSPCGRV